MELHKVGNNTYYIENPTNIGIYKIDDNSVYLIDAGNDKDAGKKILKICDEQGWSVKGVIMTHSNADHTGGAKVIQDRTGAPVLAHGIERCITEFPILEPSFLYGGYPFKDLRNKFLMAKESVVMEIDNNLPKGLEYFSLKGHFFDQIGIKTDDDVYFLGDSLFSEETITKYHLFFIYDVQEYLNTLDYLSTLKGKMFIPSHCEATNDLSYLIDLNRKKIESIANKIYDLCQKEGSFEQIFKRIFDDYGLSMNTNQYVLVGSTIRSYLAYLYDQDRIEYRFINNQMLWKQKGISEETALGEIDKRKDEAKALLNQPDKMEEFLVKLENKIAKVPIVGNELANVPIMISLVRSYIKKEYTKIPINSIVGIVGALIYVLSPIDLIPDAVPVAGLTDDATVIYMLLKSGVSDDIKEYQEWRKNKTTK